MDTRIWRACGCALVLILPVAAQAVNMINNPGFETDGEAYWDYYSQDPERTSVVEDPTSAHSGTYAMVFAKTGDDEWGFIWQRFTEGFAPGDRFKGSAWIKFPEDPEAEVFVSISLKKKETYDYFSGSSKSIKAATNWTRLEVEFTVPGADRLPNPQQSFIELAVGLRGSQAYNQLWIDDLELEKVGSGP